MIPIYLWRMEALRFARNPVHGWIVGGFTLLLLVSALWAGISADQWRQRMLASQSAAREAVTRLHEDALTHDTPGKDASPVSPAQASARLAPRLQLPLQGGLALSVRQADLLSPEIKVGINSRHTDARNSDQIANPLLLELGLLDFSTVLALLLPLAVIGLSFGLVQEDRERGVWRLVCAQTRRPWTLVAAALSVRLLAVWLPSVLASGLAFALDSGATLQAMWHWLAFVTVLSVVWTLLAAVFLLLPVGASAAALGLLGLWLATTFAVPPALAWVAQQRFAMPSRLQLVIDIRQLQHHVAEAQKELLAAWVRANPQWVKPNGTALSPVQERLPANLALDHGVRPLMLAFDQARSEQAEFMERWSWLSPSLGAVLLADRLSGLDANAYLRYTEAVNAYEDQWRAYFVPRVMRGSPLSPGELQHLPVFTFQPARKLGAGWRVSAGLTLLSLVLAATVFAGRRRYAQP
jgi:ABC-2 type transport system permease protein